MTDREQMIAAAVAMSATEWMQFQRAVGHQRGIAFAAQREAEADRLAATMDMTAEGYVREWDRQGRVSRSPLPAWEQAYQKAGLIHAARLKGYISIDRGPSAFISIEPRGEALLGDRSHG